jgi:hypothetical protein
MKNSSLAPLVGERVANHAKRESRVRGFFRAASAAGWKGKSLRGDASPGSGTLRVFYIFQQ